MTRIVSRPRPAPVTDGLEVRRVDTPDGGFFGERFGEYDFFRVQSDRVSGVDSLPEGC
jgi:hypothetical protein